jgi:hypothetical protein
MTFSAYLMEWGDDRPMGPILYKSEPRVSTVVSPECTTTCTADDFNRFDFFPNVAIEPGRRYVAFVSVAEYLPSPFDPTASGRLWSYNGNSTPSTDAYPEGEMVGMSSGLGADWTGSAWRPTICGDGTHCVDLAFAAEFVTGGYSTPVAIANAYINSLDSATRKAFAKARGCVTEKISRNDRQFEKYGQRPGPYNVAAIQNDVRIYSSGCGGPEIL